MKIQITVDSEDKFFTDLVNGEYSWATSAVLSFSGIDTISSVDATWLLTADVILQ